MNALAAVSSVDVPPPAVAPVSVVGNHVYFYTEVNQATILELIKALRQADAELARQSRDLWLTGTYLPIWLHINSEGGELPSGLAAADIIGMIKTPIYTVVEGMAASAATLLSMSGRVRYITPNAVILIHQLSQVVWGTHEDHKDNMKLQDMHMLMLRNFYAGHSKMTVELVASMLEHDTWLSADDVITYGIADAILRPGDL